MQHVRRKEMRLSIDIPVIEDSHPPALNVLVSSELAIPPLLRLDIVRQAQHNGHDHYLGSGRFGTCFLCKDRRDDTFCVEKAYRSLGLTAFGVKSAGRDMKHLLECSHPNIIRSRGYLVFPDGEDYFAALIQDWAEGGDLRRAAVLSTRPASEAELLYVARCIAAGLQYLHEDKGLVHRDLKPSNILIARDGKLLLADFSLVRRLVAESSDSKPSSARMQRTMTAAVGTDTYMAPEMDGCDYTEKVDIWALGCILYELGTRKQYRLYGPVPFPVLNEVKHSHQLKCMRAEVVELIEACLSHDPHGRPSAAQILTSPLVASATLPADAFWLLPAVAATSVGTGTGTGVHAPLPWAGEGL